jgi:hypothetical protein
MKGVRSHTVILNEKLIQDFSASFRKDDIGDLTRSISLPFLTPIKNLKMFG